MSEYHQEGQEYLDSQSNLNLKLKEKVPSDSEIKNGKNSVIRKIG